MVDTFLSPKTKVVEVYPRDAYDLEIYEYRSIYTYK
jgi:hypothetical protein